MPIDVLLCSLARDQGDRAIGVILSGMGSDGTIGLQAIKTQGGLTLVQSPDTAQFASMPRSAMNAGAVDIVDDAAELPAHIMRIVRAPQARVLLEDRASHALHAGLSDADDFSGILALLNGRRKHDLTLYKPNTLRRRIERRMGVHGKSSYADYEAFLRENPTEIDLLFKEVLIGVTQYFRDPQVWQELARVVIPALLARAEALLPVRAWVVGCSTGEEAYSLAMLFAEALTDAADTGTRRVQIFATDLSADAVAAARRGYYPAGIADAVGQERMARFFQASGTGFVVTKEIRDMVLFAEHDVILDPPFTRLDLLSCRNVMIYFNAELQQRLLRLFHYAMRPGGVLLLGESESIGRTTVLFAPLAPKMRLYRRTETAGSVPVVAFATPPSAASSAHFKDRAVPNLPTGRPNLQQLADQLVLQDYAPAAALVNAQGDVLYINGRTGKYLEPAAGKANWNIHVMAVPSIRARLGVALRDAVNDRRVTHFRGVTLDAADGESVDVTVQPVLAPPGLEGTVLVVFRDVAIASSPKRKQGRVTAAESHGPSEELIRLREEIRLLRQEMRTSEEELQATNEELQSTNEELQSANEELTTSKEESQSMNEELQTINTELQSKLDALALAQSDMQNLLNSTDIATLFLDSDLNVRRFTERITRIIHLREGDIGRPLSDLASTLDYPDLEADARETVRTLACCEKQIPTSDGYWYSVRIMPYRTIANVIQGAVIIFVDITAAKKLESRLRGSQ